MFQRHSLIHPLVKRAVRPLPTKKAKQEKEDLAYNQQDFWATTGNKQLNFVQHIRSMLKTTGKATVVGPG